MATKSSALHLYDLKFLIQIKKTVQVSKRVPPGEGRDLQYHSALMSHPSDFLAQCYIRLITCSGRLIFMQMVYFFKAHSLCLIQTLQVAFVS